MNEMYAQEVTEDSRWQVVERILQSEPFQKSNRLQNLLRHLALYTITDERARLTEQVIGRDVFGKSRDYTPVEDSSVRVYVRQLRLRLHEYYDGPGREEAIIVSIPKGGYALAFSSPIAHTGSVALTDEKAVGAALAPVQRHFSAIWYVSAMILLALVGIVGWYRALTVQSPSVPWPLNIVVNKNSTATVVLADSGFVLRLLGDKEVPLDSYINHSYLEPLFPQNIDPHIASVLRYYDTARTTSITDAHAASALTALVAPYTDNLTVRSARDINVNDLTSGNFVFVGSKTSTPWVELFEDSMNFQIVEEHPYGERYVLNRNPQPGEQATYKTNSGGPQKSGEDYAIIASVPTRTGRGHVLILEGVRMEGSEATIALLLNHHGELTKLEKKLAALNNGTPPVHFEALIHAQSVAGTTIAVEITAVRIHS